MFRVDSHKLINPRVVQFHKKQDKRSRFVELEGKRYLRTDIEYTGNIAPSDLALLGVSCLFDNFPHEDTTEAIMLPLFSGILCELPLSDATDDGNWQYNGGYIFAKMVIRYKLDSVILTKTVHADRFYPDDEFESSSSTTELVGVEIRENFTNSPILPIAPVFPIAPTLPIAPNLPIVPTLPTVPILQIVPTSPILPTSTISPKTENTTNFVNEEHPNQLPKQHRQVTIEPLIIPVFGNTPLLMHITSLLNAPVKVICTFFELSKVFERLEGMVLSANDSLIICPVPFLTTYGKINLEVQLVHDSENTEILFGYFYAQRETECSAENFASFQVERGNEEMITLQPVSMNTTWKNVFLKPEIAQYFREISTHKELVIYGYDGSDWDNGIVVASGSQNEIIQVDLSDEELYEILDKNMIPAFGIKETLVTNSGENITGVTFQTMNESFWLLHNLRNLTGYINFDSHFATKCQTALNIEQCYTSTISAPCPETLKQAKSDWMFIEDKPVQLNDENLELFTKAVPSRSGEGVQCLYGKTGNLSSFSHKHLHTSTFWKNHWNYYKTDFAPFMYCCGIKLNSENCENFAVSEKRYANNGNYSFPKFILAVSTGKLFPFQGRTTRAESLGEFWALKYHNQNETTQSTNSSYASFKLQFRVEEFINLKGESKGVPVITTVAIVDRENNNNFALQISRDKNQLRVQVNEREPYFIFSISKIPKESSKDHTLYFDQATIMHMPSVGQLLATFKSGFSVKLYLAGDNEMGLSFIVSASEKQLQNSVGLLAGSSVHGTETVNAWRVSETDTIFLYTVENPRSVYHPSDVSLRVPSLLNLQIGEIVNPGLEGVMDFLATGSESIGNSTRMIHEEFSLLKTAFKK